MNSSLLKHGIWSIISITVFAIVYVTFFCIAKRQTMLNEQILDINKALHLQSEKLQMLKKISKASCSLNSSDASAGSSITEAGLVHFAQKHHFLNIKSIISKELILYRDKNFYIKKISVGLSFAIKTDDDLWEFLKDLSQSFSGIIIFDNLSLEKLYDKDRDGLILRGSYHFEWYSLCPAVAES